MVETIAFGERRARRPHRCFHCHRDIARGEVYGFQTNKYDYIYTLCWHLDCEELASKCRDLAGHDYWIDEGWNGLREAWEECGEYRAECSAWRGFYPHVVARMELTDQINGVNA